MPEEIKKIFTPRKGNPFKKTSHYKKSSETIFKIAANPHLHNVLGRIGIPADKPFVADDFQVEALKKLKDADVLVTAPTGSGKTWIAEQAVADMLRDGKRSWYASPLKALSNSIYSSFKELFGEDNVGILTGDRKENTSAPVIVGTTEILRNQFYDAMHMNENVPVDLVILDEVHYLGDPWRGVVWEEVLIYMPSRIRLLMLSATISNSHEIADWLVWQRGVPCVVVDETKRPVPLYPLFMFPEGEVCPLESSNGLFSKIERWLSGSKKRGFGGRGQLPPYGKILSGLRKMNLAPAIFFLKSRADCNNSLKLCSIPPAFINPEKEDGFNRLLEQRLEEHPYLKTHPQLGYLVKYRVAAHHGGQLPRWKQFVEDFMKKGYLEAIFSTSTVAAGVNFPARTVIISQSDKYNGKEFVDLNTTELMQMTGRAGRRGMDRIGFAMVLPGPFQNTRLIQSLFTMPANPVLSQIKINFSMALNLLLSHNKEEIKDIFDASLETYQRISRDLPNKKNLQVLYESIDRELSEANCHNAEEAVTCARLYTEYKKNIRDIEKELKLLTNNAFKLSCLTKGRLFLNQKGKLHCCIKLIEKKNSKGILALSIRQESPDKVSVSLPIRWMSLKRVSIIFDGCIEIQDGKRAFELKKFLETQTYSGLTPIPESTSFTPELQSKINDLKEALISDQRALDEIPCNGCKNYSICFSDKGGDSFKKMLIEAKLLNEELSSNQEFLWSSFLQHIRFLTKEGYVNKDGQLTKEGIWASRLRVDQPLLMAECIKTGIFSNDNPVLLAAMLAPFVSDRGKEIYVPEHGMEVAMLKAKFQHLTKSVESLLESLKERGFPVITPCFWPMAAIYNWASGMQWDELINLLKVDEGDMAMLIYRTADHLRQIIDLDDIYPELSECARQAVGLLIREPVMPE